MWEPRSGRGTIRGPAHFWSLAVEERFYMIWPLVVLLANSRRLILHFRGSYGYVPYHQDRIFNMRDWTSSPLPFAGWIRLP